MAKRLCYQCRIPLRRKRRATSQGSGCIVVLIGLLFAPCLIGIPVIIYGIYLMGQEDRWLECPQCGNKITK